MPLLVCKFVTNEENSPMCPSTVQMSDMGKNAFDLNCLFCKNEEHITQ